jgi:hypothetical protein
MLLFFAPYGAMYQLFFNASYQAKAIAIGLSKAYIILWLNWLIAPLLFALQILAHAFAHSTYKESPPDPLLHRSLFPILRQSMSQIIIGDFLV